MSFLNLFKKEAIKKSDPFYRCWGVKARRDQFSQEDLDSCFDFVKNLQTKYYTEKEIATVSENIGFNLHDYYVYIEVNLAKREDRILTQRVMQLWQGVKNDSIIPEDLKNKLHETLSQKGLLDRTEIENLSITLGFSVYDHNNWKSYLITDWDFGDGNIYSCITDPRDHEDLKKKYGIAFNKDFKE